MTFRERYLTEGEIGKGAAAAMPSTMTDKTAKAVAQNDAAEEAARATSEKEALGNLDGVDTNSSTVMDALKSLNPEE